MNHPPTTRPTRRPGVPVALSVLTALLATVLVTMLGAGVARADGATAGATPPGKAWIRAGHFVPGFGAARVDLRPATGSTSSIVMSPNASYGAVTSYQKIEPGTYVVDIRSTGAAVSSAPMLSRSFTVGAGTASTVAVLGTATAPRLAVLADDLTPPAAGTARVRVLSAATHATSLGVTARNGPVIATGAVLGQTTPYATVPQGAWTLTVDGGTGPATTSTVNLTGGSIYTAVALDSGATGLRLSVVTDAAGATTMPAGAAATGLGGSATAAAVAASPDSALSGPLGLALLAGLLLVGVGATAGAARLRTRPVGTLPAPTAARSVR